MKTLEGKMVAADIFSGEKMSAVGLVIGIALLLASIITAYAVYSKRDLAA